MPKLSLDTSGQLPPTYVHSARKCSPTIIIILSACKIIFQIPSWPKVWWGILGLYLVMKTAILLGETLKPESDIREPPRSLTTVKTTSKSKGWENHTAHEPLNSVVTLFYKFSLMGCHVLRGDDLSLHITRTPASSSKLPLRRATIRHWIHG